MKIYSNAEIYFFSSINFFYISLILSFLKLKKKIHFYTHFFFLILENSFDFFLVFLWILWLNRSGYLRLSLQVSFYLNFLKLKIKKLTLSNFVIKIATWYSVILKFKFSSWFVILINFFWNNDNKLLVFDTLTDLGI